MKTLRFNRYCHYVDALRRYAPSGRLLEWGHNGRQYFVVLSAEVCHVSC